MKDNKGISLIVLVITIIVITVLASVVILTISSNNQVENANKYVKESNEVTLQETANTIYIEYNTEKNLGRSKRDS